GQKRQIQQAPPPQPDWDKKIIKTATLNVEIKDFEKFYVDVREKVKQLGGYIAQEEQVQNDYKIQNAVVIKIPVDQFDNAIIQVTSNTEKINEKKINSEDVTTEVVDTKSRMEAKKQVRQRYMDLLKQAKNMEEILNVQSEINDIQVEIESAAGRIQYLGHSSSFSTIHLTYFQILNPSVKDPGSPAFGNKITNAFANGWSWFSDLFIGLISIWPLYILIFACIIIYKRSRILVTRQKIS
ncbi:MAG TPA: DUF4349 domain-containing protein, partial [Chitinophagaceae bacterium]|nr:DUF4349 domain-containing protein [Chitinophagaceae bacterium]